MPPAAFEKLKMALPPWPRSLERVSKWILVHGKFAYSNQAKYTNCGAGDPEPGRSVDPCYCVPEAPLQQLCLILGNQTGGSVLITGYRGTGKTSLANAAIHRCGQNPVARRQRIVVRINLSTARDSRDLLYAMIQKLKDELAAKINARGAYRWVDWRDKRLDRRIAADLKELFERTRSEVQSAVEEERVFKLKLEEVTSNVGSRVLSRRALSTKKVELGEGQIQLTALIQRLSQRGFKVVFLIDELDKLVPPGESGNKEEASQRMRELQGMVSDLKYLLTGATSHNIFIAGKDVDDSWKEDQNKGDGLFESAFCLNIYMPSMFSAQLSPAVGAWAPLVQRIAGMHQARGRAAADQPRNGAGENPPLPWRDLTPDRIEEQIVEVLTRVSLREISIVRHGWCYNTALLVLPTLDIYDLVGLLARAVFTRAEGAGKHEDLSDEALEEKFVLVDGLGKILEPTYCEDGEACTLVWAERSCRRLNSLIKYLTYKGRGIPRKVYREYHSIITRMETARVSEKFQTERQNALERMFPRMPPPPPAAAISISPLLQQKISFYADITSRLEEHPSFFRSFDDKSLVATFHIVDYILRHFRTGLSWRAIEHSRYFNERQELFPSRALVTHIIKFLEGVIIERSTRRDRVFRILPRVKADLGMLYNSFGFEQLELRFTHTDFREELDYLHGIMARVDETLPAQRLNSFLVQLRVAEIQELMESYPKAIVEYAKAVRFLRMDLIWLREVQAVSPGKDNDLHLIQRQTHLAFLISALQRLGHNYETVGEYRAAALHYREANRLARFGATRFVKDRQPLQASQLAFDQLRDFLRSSTAEAGKRCVDGIHALLQQRFGKGGQPSGDQIPFEPHGYEHDVHSVNLLAILALKTSRIEAAEPWLWYNVRRYIANGNRSGLLNQLMLQGAIYVRHRLFHEATQMYWLIQKLMGRAGEADLLFGASVMGCLGDVLLATRGLGAMADLRVLLSAEGEPESSDRLLGSRNIPDGDDDHPLVYRTFRRAFEQYMSAGDPFSAFDSMLKAIALRRRNLKRAALAPGGRDSSEAISAALAAFWEDVSAAWSCIVEYRPAVRTPNPRGYARIRDYRRFGEICMHAGICFGICAQHERLRVAVMESLEPGGADGPVKNFLAFAFDHSEPVALAAGRIRTNVGPRSPIWDIAKSPEFERRALRNFFAPTFQENDCADSDPGLLPLLLEWIHLQGGAPAWETATRELELLSLSEKVMLVGFCVQSESIRDIDLMHSSASLARLYLRVSCTLLAALKGMEAKVPSGPAPGAGDQLLDLIYTLHLAAKRFAANGIEILLEMKTEVRAMREHLGELHAILGDIMLVWYDSLTSGDVFDQDGRQKQEGRYANEIKDFSEEDVQRKVVNAYCDSLRVIAESIQDYLDGYRSSEDLSYTGDNIVDIKSHHAICKTARARSGANVCDGAGVRKQLTEITNHLVRPYAVERKEKSTWLKEFSGCFACVTAVTVRERRVRITVKDSTYRIELVGAGCDTPSVRGPGGRLYLFPRVPRAGKGAGANLDPAVP